MINHEYRCIFINIQRTAGSAIEKLICGYDWWSKDSLRAEKHLTASQAKALYSDYWDSYFKFSIVRNPWSRMVSMLKWGAFLGVETKFGTIDISKYKKYYGFPGTLEYDRRFHPHRPCFSPSAGQAYSNILDCELDFVGSFEKLDEDVVTICKSLGIVNKFSVLNRPNFSDYDSLNYRSYYCGNIRDEIDEMYKIDNEKFDYSF